uniref:Uncharacterized protein n=1 Tax=Anguilla anguilla TaxID=7936 RepID=A0A0E9SSH2_ANGAN
MSSKHGSIIGRKMRLCHESMTLVAMTQEEKLFGGTG